MQTTDPYIGPPVDVWSTGVILYIMIGGAFPFTEATMHCDLYAALVNGTFVWPETFSADLIDLLKKMFTTNPRERITVPQILEHQWVNPEAAAQAAAKAAASAKSSIVMDDEDAEFNSMLLDDEPQYRTLDADIMDTTSGFEEEPVYRSIDIPGECGEAYVAAPSPECNSTAFGCRATETFDTCKPAAQVLQDLANQIRQCMPTATVVVKEECGQVKIETTGPSGDIVKVKFVVTTDAMGTTQVSVKRMRGHALDYKQMFCGFRSTIVETCEA